MTLCIQTQLTLKLNQKFTKSILKLMLATRHLHEGKNTLWVKEGEGHLFKWGVYFWELTVSLKTCLKPENKRTRIYTSIAVPSGYGGF